jgi:hypothetical protein
MTTEDNKIPKFIAIDRALARFFVVSGSGQGMRFYDPVTASQLTIHNVVNWVNQRIGTEELLGWAELVNKRWNALLPEARYQPNMPAVFPIEPGLYVRNLWSPPPIEPSDEVDPAFFLAFLDDAIGRDDREYLIKWLAWQYQRPLEKPHTGIYLYGPQGTGKGTIANVLEAVFGSSAVMRIADQSKLGSMSSVDIWSRTLLVVEEVEVSIKDKLANTIKSFMGTNYVDADRKHEHFGRHFIPANLIMLSNNPPTMLEKDDRRWYVREMQPQSDPVQYFKELYAWLEKEGGHEAVAHLLATTDISDMNLSDRPRWTDEKALACDMATKQDVLDVLQVIEQSDGLVFTPADFKHVCGGNRLLHIAAQVGLKCVDLNAIGPGSRCKAKGFTEAECKRLLIPIDAEIFQDGADHNAWKLLLQEKVGYISDLRPSKLTW